MHYINLGINKYLESVELLRNVADARDPVVAVDGRNFYETEYSQNLIMFKISSEYHQKTQKFLPPRTIKTCFFKVDRVCVYISRALCHMNEFRCALETWHLSASNDVPTNISWLIFSKMRRSKDEKLVQNREFLPLVCLTIYVVFWTTFSSLDRFSFQNISLKMFVGTSFDALRCQASILLKLHIEIHSCDTVLWRYKHKPDQL